jgi:WD40 repeat protein
VAVGNAGYVQGLLYSPDGKRLISSAAGSSVRVWDTETWELLQRIDHGKRNAGVPVLSPDGKALATHSGRGGHVVVDPERPEYNLELWDMGTGGRIRVLPGHSWGTYVAAYSPDARLLASAGQDRLVKVWDVESGRLLQTFSGLGDDRPLLEFRDGGKKLLAVAFSGAHRIWGVGTGEELSTVGPSVKGVWPRFGCAALSSSGVLAVSGGGPRNHAQVQIRETVPGVLESTGGAPEIVVDQGDPEEIALYDLERGTLLHRIPDAAGMSGAMKFSPDGSLLAVGGMNNPRIQLWDVSSGTREHVLDLTGGTNQGGSGDEFAFSPDGSLIATVWFEELAVWNTPTAKRLWKAEVKQAVRSPVFSPDGRQICVGRYSGSIRIYDVRGGLLKELPNHIGWLSRPIMSPDGRLIVTRPRGYRFRLWDAKNGVFLRRLEMPKMPSTYLPDCFDGPLEFSPDGRLAASLGNTPEGLYCFYVWDAETGRVKLCVKLSEKPHHRVDGRLRFIRGGKTLLFATHDGLRAWRTSDGVVEGEAILPHAYGSLEEFMVSPDEKHAALALHVSSNTSPGGREVAIWDTRGFTKLRELTDTSFSSEEWIEQWSPSYIPPPSFTSCVVLAFSGDGRLLATGDGEGFIRVWNVPSGKLAYALKSEEAVASVSVSPDGRFLTTTDYDADGALWDLVEKKRVESFPAQHIAGWAVGTPAFSADGERLMGFSDGKAWVRRIDGWQKLDTRDPAVFAGMPFSGPAYPVEEREGFALVSPIDGRRLLHLRLMSSSDEEEDEWLVYTPDGYYAGSEGVERFLRVRSGGRLLPMEPRAAKGRRPDRIREAAADQGRSE